MSVADQLITGITSVGLVLSLALVITYHRLTRGDWRNNTAGPFIMSKSLLLASIFLIILLNRLVPGWRAYVGGDWLLVVLYSIYALTPAYWLRLLLRAQRRNPHRRDES